MYKEAARANGFLINEDLFSLEEMASVLAGLTEVPHSRAGSRHLMSVPVVREIASDARLLRIAEEAVGKSVVPFRATLFDKSPTANWKVGWHQDTALPLTQRKDCEGWGPWSVKEGIDYAHAPTRALERVVALRVHLDPSITANGPLRAVPGTHRLGVLSDDEVASIALRSDAVECVGGCGSVLMMRPLLIHASSKSQSDIPRRVLHVEYATTLSIDVGLELAVA